MYGPQSRNIYKKSLFSDVTISSEIYLKIATHRRFYYYTLTYEYKI